MPRLCGWGKGANVERETGMSEAQGHEREADAVPRFGLIIVGDEILSGKRPDKHLVKVIELLGARGLQLAWAHYAGDDRGALVRLLEGSFASGDVVFSCGGIGATSDDHTRQAAAAALRRELALHPEAERLITERCVEMAREGRGEVDMSSAENRQRLKMGEFPGGATIIPNPYNRIPGFAVQRHWFVPGFPVMAWPMIEWVLDTHYAQYFHREARAEHAFLVFEVPESRLTPIMEEIEAAYPAVRTFSLPSVGDGNDGRTARRHVEFGVKGPPAQAEAAFALMRERVAALGVETG
jgi:molybdopterin-biosynthesis enzyme MoeA-like protein